MSRQLSRGSAGEYQADEQAGVARLRWIVSGRWAGRCRASPLASIRQMGGIKWISNKMVLYSTGNSAQCYVEAWMAGEFRGEWIHVYIWLSSSVVHLKLSQQCYLATLQYKIKIFLEIWKTAFLKYRYMNLVIKTKFEKKEWAFGSIFSIGYWN